MQVLGNQQEARYTFAQEKYIGRWGIEALESQVKSVKTWHANERAASIYDISSGASPACNHAQVPATVTATQWRIDIAMGSAPALVL